MVALIHHPDYDAATVPDGHRFPMRKYSLVAEMLRARGERFLQPEPASPDWLKSVHAPGYVDAVMAGTLDQKAARRIGFDITDAVATRSRSSVGGTWLGALEALQWGAAVNLAGGSHHADPHGGAGFCVFNDVGVAARRLIDTGVAGEIAIIDLDVHHGDGTARMFASDPHVFTASLHCEANWPRTKPPSDLDIGLDRTTGDAGYLAALSRLLEEVFERCAPDLVFYNAGVDPHRNDRLGLLDLSDDGLRARDLAVAKACRVRGIPVCGVLGGGYEADASAVAARHLYLVDAMQAVFTPSRAL